MCKTNIRVEVPDLQMSLEGGMQNQVPHLNNSSLSLK